MAALDAEESRAKDVPVALSLAAGLGLCDANAGGDGAPAGQFRCNNIGNSLSQVVDGDGSVPAAHNGTAYDAVECRAESKLGSVVEDRPD